MPHEILSRLKLSQSRKPQVMIVDDEPINIEIICAILGDNYHFEQVTSGVEAFQKCCDLLPDIILMDIEMPGINGLDVCHEIKNCAETRDIPVVFITAHTEPELQDACWNAGCVDFITKPFVAATITNRIKAHLKLKFMTDELRDMAMLDGLTGVYNRRYFDNYLTSQSRHADREHHSLSLLMIDIDYFKQFNDTYGHLEGDDCLKSIASILNDCASRPTDVVARYGGEEFAIVLPETTEVGAQRVADDIKARIKQANIAHKASSYGHVTVSIGVVSCHRSPQDTDDLIAFADKNLYEAKELGRNRSVKSTEFVT